MKSTYEDESLEILKKVIGKHEEFLDIKQALSVPNEVKPISRDMTESCDIGCYFSVKQNQPNVSKLMIKTEKIESKILKKLRIDGPHFSISNDHQKCTLFMTYEDYEESVDQNDRSFHDTIKNTVYAHFVCTKIVGLRAIIELSSSLNSHTKQSQFESIVDVILGKTTLENAKDIVIDYLSSFEYSLSGQLPLDVHRVCETLDEQNLLRLQNLCCEQKIATLCEQRFPLSMCIVHVNLLNYFHPIFEKLFHIYKLKSELGNYLEEWIIDYIIKRMLEKIKLSATLIKSCENYEDGNIHLQTSFKTFLLNAEQIKGIIISLNNLTETELKSMNDPASSVEGPPYRKDFKRRIVYDVSLSLNEPHIALRDNLETIDLNKSQLLKIYVDALKRESDKVKKRLKEFELTRKQWEKCLQRNVKFDICASISSDKSDVAVRLCNKDGISMEKDLPIFAVPFDIVQVKTTDNSITIAWTMPLEENNSFVISYRVDYCEANGEDWHTVFTQSGVNTETTVNNLSPGEYLFRVQPIFESYPGIFSDKSEKLSTRLQKSFQFRGLPSSWILFAIVLLVCGILINFQGLDKVDRIHFTYTKEQREIIGKNIPHEKWNSLGPVECLDEEGHFRFVLANSYSESIWYRIVNKISYAYAYSRPFILPVELSGHTLISEISGSYSMGKVFDISFMLLSTTENENMALRPFIIRVQFMLKLLDGSYAVSQLKTFTFTRIGYFSKSSRMSFSGANESSLPELVFKFY